jgi:hypothetical protein
MWRDYRVRNEEIQIEGGGGVEGSEEGSGKSIEDGVRGKGDEKGE